MTRLVKDTTGVGAQDTGSVWRRTRYHGQGVEMSMSDWGGWTGEVGTRPELVQKAHRVSGKGLDTLQKGVRICGTRKDRQEGAKGVQRRLGGLLDRSSKSPEFLG